MAVPFIAPNRLELKLEPWVMAYILMPIFAKLLFCLVGEVIERYVIASPLPLANGSGPITPEKKCKTVIHASKAIIYFASILLMAPLFINICGQFNVEPVQPLSSPFVAASQNYQYLKWVFSIVVGVYEAELIWDRWPSIITWLHHGASIVGSCLLSGAVPWLNQTDTLLFAGSAVIAWFCLAANCFGHCGFAIYHLSTQTAMKLKVVNLSHYMNLISLCQHVLSWVWLALKWYHWQSWAPILVLFGIEVVLLAEHTALAYNLHGMRKKLLQAGNIDVPSCQQFESRVGSNGDAASGHSLPTLLTTLGREHVENLGEDGVVVDVGERSSKSRKDCWPAVEQI